MSPNVFGTSFSANLRKCTLLSPIQEAIWDKRIVRRNHVDLDSGADRSLERILGCWRKEIPLLSFSSTSLLHRSPLIVDHEQIWIALPSSDKRARLKFRWKFLKYNVVDDRWSKSIPKSIKDWTSNDYPDGWYKICFFFQIFNPNNLSIEYIMLQCVLLFILIF